MYLHWVNHTNMWWFETHDHHVACEISEVNGLYYAGISVPYRIGNDREVDWKECEYPFNTLEDAQNWAVSNCTQTIQGERLEKSGRGVSIKFV